MKKSIILLILSFCLISAKLQAQTSTGTIVYMKTTLASMSMSDTGDIITDARDTGRFYLNVSNSTNGSIQVYTAYCSGTAPIVTAMLEVSNNGVTWNRRQAVLQQTGDTLNLLPLSGISASGTLSFPINNWQYLRVSIFGHKTQSVGIKATACLRKDKN